MTFAAAIFIIGRPYVTDVSPVGDYGRRLQIEIDECRRSHEPDPVGPGELKKGRPFHRFWGGKDEKKRWNRRCLKLHWQGK
jgi:hypothetical protein